MKKGMLKKGMSDKSLKTPAVSVSGVNLVEQPKKEPWKVLLAQSARFLQQKKESRTFDQKASEEYDKMLAEVQQLKPSMPG